MAGLYGWRSSASGDSSSDTWQTCSADSGSAADSAADGGRPVADAVARFARFAATLAKGGSVFDGPPEPNRSMRHRLEGDAYDADDGYRYDAEGSVICPRCGMPGHRYHFSNPDGTMGAPHVGSDYEGSDTDEEAEWYRCGGRLNPHTGSDAEAHPAAGVAASAPPPEVSTSARDRAFLLSNKRSARGRVKRKLIGAVGANSSVSAPGRGGSA